MADYQPGSMDTTAQERAFNGLSEPSSAAP